MWTTYESDRQLIMKVTAFFMKVNALIMKVTAILMKVTARSSCFPFEIIGMQAR